MEKMEKVKITGVLGAVSGSVVAVNAVSASCGAQPYKIYYGVRIP
jgi:hypothetical protein